MRNYRDYAAELSYGEEKGLKRPASAHRNNAQQDFHHIEENSGFGKSFGKGQRVGGGEKKLQLGKGKNYRDEEQEELSSLSGFTASDNEENEDRDEIKWSMAPKSKMNKYSESDEEEDEEEENDWRHENRDIMLKKENLQERFKEHDLMRRKGEQEKQRQKEILAAQNAENLHNMQTMPLKRPQSSNGAMRTSASNMQMSRTFLNTQKENMRPQTAAHSGAYEDTEDRKPVTFKPIYTQTIRETLIKKKVFNYSEKNFKTIAKKSDPVSRINAFKNEWNKTKFLKAGNQKKEGRKLNLAERNQTSKPDFIFHKYKSKYNMD